MSEHERTRLERVQSAANVLHIRLTFDQQCFCPGCGTGLVDGNAMIDADSLWCNTCALAAVHPNNAAQQRALHSPKLARQTMERHGVIALCPRRDELRGLSALECLDALDAEVPKGGQHTAPV